ncbi:DUF2147 domain-containing protein [Borreliella burgdorferi]|uniref:DUF2147 domain-containing protein n=1 Tax=Borreliella burgdorferi TaxID=139 RepID=UPI001E4BB86B|nr:DUF2147 domain-containing protein [Borreliella burgdorferi]MCD2321881.1 DUF2147 domain-containing protein [Borreliella burgdorferi]MCD2409787.1 DUF2147 domain-containing protein [Borreliella burgdorferi]MCD2415318.1 DUF2147 domain-containing protein [Borreliella burgdorferi]
MTRVFSKFFLFFCFSMLLFANSEDSNEKDLVSKDENPVFENEVLGYWVGYNDVSNIKNSIIYIYKYNGEVYGRILTIIKDGKKYDTKNPSGDTVVGFENLAIEGLDFMWGLKYSSSSKKWDRGKIIDPKNGKIYNSEMRVDSKTGNLITKGKVWIFGRSKIWTRAKDDEIPKLDLHNLVPAPPVKK